jgi:dTDP-L-rhamnose 4-epimerase
VRKLVVASSMSIYGEGLYTDGNGREVEPSERTREQLAAREWDYPGLEPVPTPERKRPGLSSIYALTKYDQERTCLVAGAAYGIPTVALRLFNTYGPRQALSNPYTGALAIFAARLLNGRPPRIFEDGLQRRDFVSVRDVARAFALALEQDGADGQAVNVGSGRSVTVRGLATDLGAVVGRECEPEITGESRVGDIRHCFADVGLAHATLGYTPAVELADGMTELAAWLEGQTAEDRVDDAARELARRGLSL